MSDEFTYQKSIPNLPATAADLRRITPRRHTLSQQVEDLWLKHFADPEFHPLMATTSNEDAQQGHKIADQYRAAVYLKSVAPAGSAVAEATDYKVRDLIKATQAKYGIAPKQRLALNGFAPQSSEFVEPAESADAFVAAEYPEA